LGAPMDPSLEFPDFDVHPTSARATALVTKSVLVNKPCRLLWFFTDPPAPCGVQPPRPPGETRLDVDRSQLPLARAVGEVKSHNDR
jgi:hypothetical protein